ncbi:MAG TPA: hypothetical protein VF677_05500 [Flavobacterium sp.]
MTELEIFEKLKQKVLLIYQEYHPYYRGNWKNFSAQDIQNLIILIEEKTKQNVSEKWIYTHLKPETNLKLPRKDMLEILSRFSGYSGWDEFNFKNREVNPEEKTLQRPKIIVASGIAILFIGLVVFMLFNQTPTQKFQLKNEFTKETIQAKDIKAYKIENNEKVQIPIKNA